MLQWMGAVYDFSRYFDLGYGSNPADEQAVDDVHL